MYQHKIETFGALEKVKIWDEKTGNGFSFVPGFGANLLELNFGGQNILDGFQTPEELQKGDWGKSVFLFPFPNRLKDGTYELDGKKYHFPINDGSGNNALHGLGTQKPFAIKDILVQEGFAKVICQYQDDGKDLAYPFPFLCEISFMMKNTNEFEVEMFFTNQTSHPIPVGLGWHPYFVLDKKVENYSLQLPECRLVEVDDEMIPTGVKKAYNIFKSKKKIAEISLDTCFELEKKEGRANIVMEGAIGRINYWQEAGDRRWNFFQIFTPPAKTSVAIEPMTCNVDAFNNQDGLVMLESGGRLGGKFGVVFQK